VSDISPYLSLPFWLARPDVVCYDENDEEIPSDSPLLNEICVSGCETCMTTMVAHKCGNTEGVDFLIWTKATGFGEKTISAIVENANRLAGVPLTFLDRALPMIKRNVPVIPLAEKTKIPFLTGWENLATTDENQIRQWAAAYPTANCGCVARAELGGIWLFEVDSKEVLERMAAAGVSEPETFKVRSREDRYHFYFRNNHDSLTRLENIPQGFVIGKDFSVRADNEQCASPLSIHPVTGRPYEIMADVPIAEAPPQLITWLLTQRTAKTKEGFSKKAEGWLDEPMEEGTIHDRMVAVAGKLRDAGLGEADIYAVLRQKGDTLCYCQNGDPKNAGEFQADDEKLRQIARSMMNYKTGEQKRKEKNQALPATNNGNRKWGEALTLEEYLDMVDVTSLSHPLENDVKEIEIPPFDPSVMTGVARELVELVQRGTTLVPQFAFGVAKTLIGARMAASGMTFQYLDAPPRRYLSMIGVTGTGKGAAWDRTKSILMPEEGSATSFFKVMSTMDSAAGTKDFFFEYPEEAPVVCYIAEIADFGDKAAKNRNPETLGLLVDMADNTLVTRTLAQHKGQKQTRSKPDCQLVAVICGQDGYVYGEAFGARRAQGIYDRLTPEFAEVVEPGDMDPIPLESRMPLLTKFISLPYTDAEGRPSKMTMDAEAKACLDAFWASRSKEVKTKVRFYKFLLQDAYFAAFFEGRLSVTAADALKAMITHEREMAIRAAHFGTSIGDKVSYYSARIKQTTAQMREQLAGGVPPEQVAQTERDYMNKTRAYQNNEEKWFGMAWMSHVKVFLVKVRVKVGRNQRWVEKYLPAPVD